MNASKPWRAQALLHHRSRQPLGVMLLVLASTMPVPAKAAPAVCLVADAPHLWLDFEGSAVVAKEGDGRTATLQGVRAAQGCTAEREPRAGSAAAKLGMPRIDFEAGNEAERSAAVVSDEQRPANHVLRFSLASANVRTAKGIPAKGRVQMDVYGNRSITEVSQSVRMRLGPGFQTLVASPGPLQWLTISEWWNNPGWGKADYPFRISVNLVKPDPGPAAAWRVAVHAQTMDLATKKWETTVWRREDPAIHVPVGKWVTMDTRFVEGNAEKGRFVVTVTAEGGAALGAIDVKGFTHHPDNPRPDGLSHWNPVKLYTGARNLAVVQSRSEKLYVDWDDLKVVGCGTGSARPCDTTSLK